jgi:uncharacterized membrane protein
MLQLISIMLVVYSFFLVRTTLSSLPSRIPMHFNSAGVVNGWGTPGDLWLLVGAQALICAIFILVPYLGQLMPDAIHLGTKRLSDFPIEARPRVLALFSNMGAWINAVMNLFFVDILRQVIQAARQTNPQITPILPLVVMTACLAAIVIYYLFQFNSAGKDAGTHTLTPE